MRLLPASSGVYSEDLASFTFKVVQEALNSLNMEAANSFETLVPLSPPLSLSIYIYIQGVPGGMCQTSGGCSLC